MEDVITNWHQNCLFAWWDSDNEDDDGDDTAPMIYIDFLADVDDDADTNIWWNWWNWWEGGPPTAVGNRVPGG